MKELKLSSVENDSYQLNGAVKELLANRRAKMMMRTQLPYTETDDAIIFKSESSIEKVAATLKVIANYIDARVVYDAETGSALAEYKMREEDFLRFSENAKNIKDNHCDPIAFKEFTDILDEKMPARILYPLQLLSAYHLAFSQNSCNFSVPGAGKTSIVYGAYTYLKHCQDASKRVDKILIIGPLSSFGPWENEYEECFGKKARSQRINGAIPIEQRRLYFYEEAAEITLISYQSVVNLQSELEYFLQNNHVMVVLDEAHKAKNTSGGIVATSVLNLSKYCKARIVLTGTPAPNGYEDLYNLFHFIWPQFDVVKFNIAQLRDMSRTPNDPRIPKLMDYLSPFFIRIRKSDLGLPSAIENAPIYVPMEGSHKRIYEYIEERFVEEASRGTREEGLHGYLVKARLIRLRQAATNPALLREPISSFAEESGEELVSVEAEDAAMMHEIMRFYSEQVPAKYKRCLELVRSILDKGEKVIIWVTFIKNIEYLSSYLKDNGIECEVLYGATPIANESMSEEELAGTREGIVKEFNSINSRFNVVIANPFAVAESISLHKACHNAIYLERSFDCAQFLQSKDRIHRYGLPKGIDTNYYYILSEDSIDETIDLRLKEKERRMMDIIEHAPIPLFLNTTEEGDEDIKAILYNYVRRKARQNR